MSSAASTALPTCVAPEYSCTVLPLAAAVPSVAVVLKRTRRVGVLSLVTSSAVDTPVSEAASRSGAAIGAAGAMVSSAVACACVIPVKFVAESIAVDAVDKVVLVTVVREPATFDKVVLLVRSTVVLPELAAVTVVTRLDSTFAATVAEVSPAPGLAAASMVTVAIWLEAFCTATATASDGLAASGSKVSRSTPASSPSADLTMDSAALAETVLVSA